jgi:hypothetical protein
VETLSSTSACLTTSSFSSACASTHCYLLFLGGDELSVLPYCDSNQWEPYAAVMQLTPTLKLKISGSFYMQL